MKKALGPAMSAGAWAFAFVAMWLEVRRQAAAKPYRRRITKLADMAHTSIDRGTERCGQHGS